MEIGKKVKFKVTYYTAERKVREKTSDELIGKIIRKEGEYLIVKCLEDDLPYVVHPEDVIS